LKTIHTGSAHNDLAVTGGYAYASRKRGGVDIIDIDPPESANVIAAIDTPGSSYDIAVSDNYAYVADLSGGLRIVKMW